MTAAFFILCFSLSGAGGTLSGVVVDPQGLPVPGARLELVCPGHAEAAETDAQGRFEIGEARDGCRLSVLHKGFAPVHQTVGRTTSLVIRLRVADVTEVVMVTPEPSNVSLRRAPGSVSLGSTDLKTLAGNTSDLIRYASLLAGAAARSTSVEVDGLPASVLPPIEMIERISVNADAFSAEHADGDVTFIQIITKAPARTFRVNGGSDVLGPGGGDVIASRSHSAARSGYVNATGPVPYLPITFAARTNFARTTTHVPLQAVVPNNDVGADTATAMNRVRSGAVDVFYSPTPSLKARSSYRESRADASNVGVGGLVLPDAGMASSFRTRDARATMTAVGARFLYEGGAVFSQTSSKTTANTNGMGISVVGDFVTGGDADTVATASRIEWASRHVFRSTSSRPWSVGVMLAGTHDTGQRTPNAAGTFQFADVQAYASALAGGDTATWFVTRGNGAIRHTSATAASFVQKTLVRSEHVEVDGGVRVDYQPGFGAIISPRLSYATEWRGFTVRAGAGLFARNVPDAVLVKATENDGQHLEQFMATGVSFVNVAEAVLNRQTRIRSQLAPDLRRPRQRMERISLDRRWGMFISAIDYTWTHDDLLGSERLSDGAEWVDVFESDRSGKARRLHTQIGYTWKRQRLVANYDWTHARDNTDGPFSFPEQPGSLATEFARSAGVSPHSVTTIGTFGLPAAISVTVTDTWRGSAPVNITTGIDKVGDGLTLDRGGRARNSGDGPGYSSMAAYGYRRVRLPRIHAKSPRTLYLDLGVQVDNILNQRNYISVGSIAGSSTFGKPLTPFPGRSVRLFLTVD